MSFCFIFKFSNLFLYDFLQFFKVANYNNSFYFYLMFLSPQDLLVFKIVISFCYSFLFLVPFFFIFLFCFFKNSFFVYEIKKFLFFIFSSLVFNWQFYNFFIYVVLPIYWSFFNSFNLFDTFQFSKLITHHYNFIANYLYFLLFIEFFMFCGSFICFLFLFWGKISFFMSYFIVKTRKFWFLFCWVSFFTVCPLDFFTQLLIVSSCFFSLELFIFIGFISFYKLLYVAV